MLSFHSPLVSRRRLYRKTLHEPRKSSTAASISFDPDEWLTYYGEAGEICGTPFAPGEKRGTIFMDTYAMQAAYHMKRYGTTQRQIATGAAKNHTHGSLNPLAQYRFKMTVDEVLADREISYPLTRSMCAPIGDGAAAALGLLEGLPRGIAEPGAGTRGQDQGQHDVGRQIPVAR